MKTQTTTRRLHPKLPVFVLEMPTTSIIYTPGNVASIATANLSGLEQCLVDESTCKSRSLRRLASTLIQAAEQAERGWQELRTMELRPSCLTVYLSNACNLGCVYCFATTEHGARILPDQQVEQLPIVSPVGRLPLLDLARLLPIARHVAQSCRQLGKPFQLVIHGGGEPTLHWHLLQQTVLATQEIAAEAGVEWRSYIATHGVIKPEQARWLGAHINRIGISCDGPPDLQNAQRPSRSGEDTFPSLRETARILQNSPAELSIRATITRQSMSRQSELVVFFVDEWQVHDLTFEALYLGASSDPRTLRPQDSLAYADHFVAAQRVADVLQARLQMSGVRLDEIHGPYCNLLRDTIQVTPDGTASACFLVTDARSEGASQMVMGSLHPTTEQFELDQTRIQQLRWRATAIPHRCHECVNIYHCARDCPDVCPVSDSVPANDGEPGLRCRIQKEVGQRWIVDLARRKQLAPWVVSKSETAEQARQIAKSLFGLPQQIDVESIVRQWQLAGHYRAVDDRRQPPPPWSPEGFEDAGESAWRQLSTQLTQTETTAALSCYVHLPFCDRKCGFCDCYSVFIPPGNNDRQEHYFQALIQEIELWSQFTNLGARPLTTVHLGGGTPTYLPAELLERLIDSLKNCFGHTPSTEWALESTTSQLSPENLQHLKTLGFTRLHIGVQSLDQRIRKIIGRQEPTEQVLQKIVLALDYGFVVTSDLIFGLPGQKQESFIHDIQQLIDLGIDGCSLYHLNESLRNQTFLNQVSGSFESPFQNYLSFHIGEQLLRVHGYEKTHFAHFSRPRDRNLYYRHVVRNEDLLALGTTADGSFGDYSYRHPPLAEYQNLLQQRQMPLQGGLRESVTAIVTRPLSASLMAGYATLTTFQNLNADSLRIRWLDYGLIEESNVKDRYVLTANGSWYLSHLLTELHCHAMEQGLQPSSTS